MKTEISLLNQGLSSDRLADMLQRFHEDLAAHDGRARRLREHCDDGLLAWANRLLPKHFRKPASTMHQWLGGQLDSMGGARGSMSGARGVKVNLLGPRGGAKSTIGTLAFPLRMALEGREPYIWIVSDTLHQAAGHLENIKTELAGNPHIAEDYPDAAGQGPVWRRGAALLRSGVMIEAVSTGQRIRGKRYGAHRPTLIICDDLQNDGHTRSAFGRQRSREWFHGTLLKAGTHRTNIVNLATALHRDALAMELDRQPGWTSRVFKAIARWPDNTTLWQQWETIYTDVANPHYRDDAREFYRQNAEPMNAGAVVLWPEEEDLYTLMCIRTESGHTAFEREKQNSPINPELCEWPEEYFDEGIWFDEWPDGLVVKTMALDPSKGADSQRGDFSAFVMLGVDRRGVIYIEADLARRPTPLMVADGVAWCSRFRPDVFGVESNQFQDLLAGEFAAEFRRQGLLDARPTPIENRTNKLVRIRRLGPYLSSHRVRFRNRPGTRLLVEQLKEFPMADHDDGPDAAEMALRLAAELLYGRARNDGLGSRLHVG